jgi:protein-disulfide isomerase
MVVLAAPALRTAVALLVVCLAVAACGGDDNGIERPQNSVRGAPTLDKRLGGVAQDQATLGDPSAPFTMVEFADLQCPFCARFDREVLPALIHRFVRTGRLRLELRPIAFLGPASTAGAIATLAAGRQGRMWHYADLFYRNQGAENSGYVTPAFLTRIAEGAGLDLAQWRADTADPEIAAALEANTRAARTARIGGTPNFRLGRTGGVLTPFVQRTTRRADFVRRLAAELGSP